MNEITIELGNVEVIRVVAGAAMLLVPDNAPLTITTLTVDDLKIEGSIKNCFKDTLPVQLQLLIKNELNASEFIEKTVPYDGKTILKKVSADKFKICNEGSDTLKLDMVATGIIGKGKIGYEFTIDYVGNPSVEKKADESLMSFDLPCGAQFVNSITNEIVTKNSEITIGTVLAIKPEVSPIFSDKEVSIILRESDTNEDSNSGLSFSKSIIISPRPDVSDSAKDILWRVGCLQEIGDASLDYGNQWETDKKLEFVYDIQLADLPDSQNKNPLLPKIIYSAELCNVKLPVLKLFSLEMIKTTKDEIAQTQLQIKITTEGLNNALQVPMDIMLYCMIANINDSQPTIRPLRDYLKEFAESINQDSGELPPLESRIDIVKNEYSGVIADLSLINQKILSAAQENQSQNVRIFTVLSFPTIQGSEPVVFSTLMDYSPNYVDSIFSSVKTEGFAPIKAGKFSALDEATGVCCEKSISFTGVESIIESNEVGIPSEQKDEFDLLYATICGEAIGQSPRAKEAVAFVIMNRVGRHEWEKWYSVSDIIKNTGFDAYKHRDRENNGVKNEFKKAEDYMQQRNKAEKNRDTSFVRDEKYESTIRALTPIYLGLKKDFTADSVFYYSPLAQAALHKSKPSEYAETPKWKFDELEETTGIAIPLRLPGDDFKFYTTKKKSMIPVWNYRAEDKKV